jgi:hypothetical protein
MKAIETFLSNYANFYLNFRDLSQSYFNKLVDKKALDDVIQPLRYKLTDSLSQVQLYVSENEFKEFKDIHQNSIRLMGDISRLYHDVAKDKLTKNYELGDLLNDAKSKNELWIQTIVERVQQDLLEPNLIDNNM